MLRGFLLVFFFTSQATLSLADCTSPANYVEFYLCSLEKHPENSIVQQIDRSADATLQKAKQLENPELSATSRTGNFIGENVGSTELSLTIPLSQYVFGRTSKVLVGESERNSLKVQSREKFFEIKKGLLKDLFRLRQIQTELELASETITTFAQIEKQYRSRRARGPEQEISLSLVTLAQSDYELKKNKLSIEKQDLEARLRIIWGKDFKFLPQWLPPFKKIWPKAQSEFQNEAHFDLQKAIAARDLALAEQKAAQLSSWPQVTFGPLIERTTEGPNSYYQYGLALNVELPIFGFNSGGRALADTNKVRADLEYDKTLKQVQYENSITLRRYQAAVESLERASSRENLAQKHHQIDGFFRQGLATGATVIEAHRQIYEFASSQNEHETEALVSLVELYQLQGKDPVEVLK